MKMQNISCVSVVYIIDTSGKVVIDIVDLIVRNIVDN